MTYCGLCWGTSVLLIGYGHLCSLGSVALWTGARYCRVGVSLKVLSFCYNRMGMFLVSGFFMTVMGVCDSIRLIIT